MDRKLRRGVFCFLVAAFAATSAHADPAGVNGREHFQRDRIRAGVQDGSLTRPETRHLVNQQRRTERLEQRMRRDDGVLGPRERLRLDRRLDRNSANIYRARHDGQSR